MRRQFTSFGNSPTFNVGDRVELLGNHSFAHDGELGTVVDYEATGESTDYRWVTVKFDNHNDTMPLYAVNLRKVNDNGTAQDESCSTGCCSW